MNEDIFEEDIDFDQSPDESVLSSDKLDTLNEKLDRIEALLNEDIAKYEEEDNRQNQEYRTVSGNSVSDNSADYASYIYDLLLDGSVTVQVIEDQDITEKPLNQYHITDALLVILIVLVLISFVDHFIEENVFKFHRRR